MRQKRLVLIMVSLLLIVSVLGISGCSKQSSETANTNQNGVQTKEKGKLTVGFCATWPPFEYRNDKGELIGFDVDMGREIAKDLNMEAKFMDADWQGLVPSLQQGDYDILISCIDAREGRQNTTDFSDVYYQLKSTVVVQKTNTDINSVEDLAGKVVGVQLGTSDEQSAEKLNTTHKFKELKKYKLPPDEFLDLRQGKIDAVIVGNTYAVYTIKSEGGFKMVGEPMDGCDIVMITRKDNPQLLQAVNKSLARMKQDGTYDNLVKKWLSL